MGIEQVVIRLFLAAGCGAVIGSDRVLKGRPAGIKTHALVALGACLAMVTGEYIMVEYGSSQDVSRLAAQVISGIGFLGAGTIMVTGQKQVLGLTTAAGLWFAGTVGISMGGGYFDLVLVAMLTWAFIFFVLAPIDNRLSRRNREIKMYLYIRDEESLLKVLLELDKQDIIITKKESLDKNEKYWIIFGTVTKSQQKMDIGHIIGDIEGLELLGLELD